MTTATQAPATQAELDAQTYAVYVGNGAGRLSKAEVARQLGISASTATDRIKRHLARTAQDAATETAEQGSPFAADPANPTEDEMTAAVQRGLAAGTVIDADEWMARQEAEGDVFAEIEAADPEMRAMAETEAAFDGKPVTEDPDESLVALLEDGEPGAASIDISAAVAKATAAATEAAEMAAAIAAVDADDARVRAMGSVPNPDRTVAIEIKLDAARRAAQDGGEDTYVGTGCPACGMIAHAYEGGHEPGCRYGKVASLRSVTPAAETGAVAVNGAVVAVIEHHDISEHEGHGHEAGHAEPAAAAPAKAEKVLVTECERCGFHFSRPQARKICQSAAACQRRQSARVDA